MITRKSKLWQYTSYLFVSIDQLGNSIAGGNADNTISARVGYYNYHYPPYLGGKTPWYWKLFKNIIDKSFYPVDGNSHCHEAYHNDAGEVFDNRGTNIMIALAACVIIIPSCVVIAGILYLLYALRLVNGKTIDRGHNLEKRLTSCSLSITSICQEISEHNIDFDVDDSKKLTEEILVKMNEIKRVLEMKNK